MQENEKIKINMYNSFFEKNQDAMLVLNENGRIIESNKAAHELLGYKKGEFGGLFFKNFFEEETIIQTAIELSSKGVSREFEAILKQKNGEKKEVSFQFTIIEINETKNQIIATMKNITKQKQIQSMIADQNKILEMIAKNESIKQILDSVALLFERNINKNGKCLILSIDEEKREKKIISAPSLSKKVISRFSAFLSNKQHIPSDIAIQTRKTVIIEEINSDKRWKEFGEITKDLEFVSYWSVPLFNDKKEVIGTFDILFDQKIQAEKEDLKFLKEASFLSGIAIDHFKTRERINHLAFHDPLTDLFNRRKLDEVVKELVNKSKKSKKRFSVLFIDLDRFKMINDTYGHDIGDLFLVEFSKRLKKSIKKTDTIARQGGDEFIIVLENTTVEQARTVAKRIIEILHKPFQIEDIEIFTTPSIGIAVYPNHGGTLEELLKFSDDAMYLAKKSGGNDIAIHNPFRKNKSKEKLSLESDIRKALQNNEFELFYQPKFCLKTRKIKGVEALIRWNHPKKGMVYPDEFIPFAEETGLIIPIGNWILKEACSQLKRWKMTPFNHLSISVNLSMKQFFKPELFYLIKEIIEEEGISPSLLELEITETMTMNIDTAKIILKKLKKLGVKLSIDDFGTGYSSFNYIKHLPIDTIKIDKSFIFDVATNEQSKNIVNIISLITKTGEFDLIAEGVETKEQLDVLEEMECHQIQGYYISKPLPVRSFEHFLIEFEAIHL